MHTYVYIYKCIKVIAKKKLVLWSYKTREVVKTEIDGGGEEPKQIPLLPSHP